MGSEFTFQTIVSSNNFNTFTNVVFYYSDWDYSCFWNPYLALLLLYGVTKNLSILYLLFLKSEKKPMSFAICFFLLI